MVEGGVLVGIGILVYAAMSCLVLVVGAMLAMFLSRQTKRAFPRRSRFGVERICNYGDKDRCDLMEPSSVDLTVILPAYNEEGRIGGMLTDTIRYLEGRRDGFRGEVIVVDDGSGDGTSEVVKAIAKREAPRRTLVGLIRFPRNHGKGAATSEGILAANGRLILYADADGATRIGEVGKLEAAMAEYDLACGSRCLSDNSCTVQRHVVRQVLMRAFKVVVGGLGGIRSVRDSQCGFKMMQRGAARRIIPRLHLDRWIFDVELLFLAGRAGLAIAEVPVNWREVGGSKLCLAVDSVAMARDLAMMRLAYALSLWR